ncbi:MAG: DNA-protecting protein DprA [Deltaproteobacteria bacterium]|nr:DNA-protecting protein DprA [Deltaproteobacteria bacterium]MBI3295423.1 DNA-protecting protein DprA [Deltaproteobacteria bacterium]
MTETKRKAESFDDYLKSNDARLVSQDIMDKLVNGYSKEFPQVFYRGDISLLDRASVSVVGTRTPSELGKTRASKIASLLVQLGYVVTSGLAKGIDAVAHKTALDKQGKTIAILGTPIHKIYPAENKALADQIAKNGLMLSPSLPHEESGKYLFPRRNRLMALLSVGTIIIEAGPTSGVVHQAAECLRQKRKLIFLKSLAEDKRLPWVDGFLKSGAKILEHPDQLRELLA